MFPFLSNLEPNLTIPHCYDNSDLLWSCYENPFSRIFSKASAKIAAFHKIYSRLTQLLTYLRNYKKAFYQEPV